MSEAGGPILEGSSARPEKPKSGVVEKVKAAVRKDFEARKSFGQEIQTRTLDRYANVVGNMNESMLKSAYKLWEPAVKLQAAAYGIMAGTVDVSAKTMLKGTRNLLSLFSLGNLVVGLRNQNIKNMLYAIGLGGVARGVDMAKNKISDIRPIEIIPRKIEDAKDYIGLKGVDILNKIIGRKPEAMAA